MSTNDAEPKAERFATNLVLRVASVLGLLIWLAATIWILIAAGFRTADIPPQTFISLLFFNFLFTVAVFYYHRRAIIVDDEGVVVVGALSFRSYPWHEIIRVEADPGYLPGYQVITRRGAFGFSRLEIQSHQRLYELLCEARIRGMRTEGLTPRSSPDDGDAEPETPKQSHSRRRRSGRRRARREENR